MCQFSRGADPQFVIHYHKLLKMCSSRVRAAGNCPKEKAKQSALVRAAKVQKKQFGEMKEVTYNGIRYFRDDTTGNTGENTESTE